jgi:hypothetical protein
MRQRAKRVKESYVFSMGVHHLVGFRVPFDELAQRLLTLAKYCVKIIYCRSHLLEITSIVGLSSLLLARSSDVRRSMTARG